MCERVCVCLRTVDAVDAVLLFRLRCTTQKKNALVFNIELNLLRGARSKTNQSCSMTVCVCVNGSGVQGLLQMQQTIISYVVYYLFVVRL